MPLKKKPKENQPFCTFPCLWGRKALAFCPLPWQLVRCRLGGAGWSVLVHLCLCSRGSQADPGILGRSHLVPREPGGHSWKWLLDGASVFPGIQPEPCIAVTRELLADWPELPHPLPAVAVLGHYSSDIRSPADPAGH